MESFEKDYEGKDRDKLPGHAEQYLNRLRSFQNSLLGWVVTWNIAFIGGLFYLIDKQQARNNQLYAKVIFLFPFGTLFLNICFLVLYFKHSYTAKEIVKNYLPDFRTEDSLAKRLLRNRNVLLLIIAVIQIVIFILWNTIK